MQESGAELDMDEIKVTEVSCGAGLMGRGGQGGGETALRVEPAPFSFLL